jgi:hypothetical protein
MLALALSLYAAVISTYLLVDGFIELENTRIMKECKEQNLMSEFDCLKQY